MILTKVFVDNIYDGYGDSPDGYGFDVNGKLSYIAEVKCFTSESKIEYLREATKELGYRGILLAANVAFPFPSRCG